MNKVELFNEVLDNVCKGTELDTDSVKSSNREECVDARYLVIAVLSEKLSDKQIAEVSGWSVQLVNKARNSFHNRCKCRWGLKELYKELICL
jgi:arginine/ornithine N-succinyltransferase beta subunit